MNTLFMLIWIKSNSETFYFSRFEVLWLFLKKDLFMGLIVIHCTYCLELSFECKVQHNCSCVQWFLIDRCCEDYPVTWPQWLRPRCPTQLTIYQRHQRPGRDGECTTAVWRYEEIWCTEEGGRYVEREGFIQRGEATCHGTTTVSVSTCISVHMNLFYWWGFHLCALGMNNSKISTSPAHYI